MQCLFQNKVSTESTTILSISCSQLFFLVCAEHYPKNTIFLLPYSMLASFLLRLDTEGCNSVWCYRESCQWTAIQIDFWCVIFGSFMQLTSFEGLGLICRLWSWVSIVNSFNGCVFFLPPAFCFLFVLLSLCTLGWSTPSTHFL